VSKHNNTICQIGKKKKEKKRRNPTSPLTKKTLASLMTRVHARWRKVVHFFNRESVGDGRFSCAAFLKHVCLFERHKSVRSVLFCFCFVLFCLFFFSVFASFFRRWKFSSLGFANRKKTKIDEDEERQDRDVDARHLQETIFSLLCVQASIPFICSSVLMREELWESSRASANYSCRLLFLLLLVSFRFSVSRCFETL
jgi:hypothetical protein